MQDLLRETSLEKYSNNTGGCQPLEFHAAVKAAATGVGCVSMMRDLGVMLQQQGVEVKAKGLGDGVDSPSLEIKLDATARRAIAMRRGAGRIRHTATPTLWLQRLVIGGDIKMTRVGGSDNCADLGTKHLDYQTMNRHLKFCGMRFAEGRIFFIGRETKHTFYPLKSTIVLPRSAPQTINTLLDYHHHNINKTSYGRPGTES